MKAVLQRVTNADVKVDTIVVSHIHTGYLILLGVADSDTDRDAESLATKISHVRVMADEKGKMNLSISEVPGEVLVVSQFTLVADVSGRRPSFTQAAPPDEAKRLYDLFVEQLRSHSIEVKTGTFGAYMAVSLTNDGPVTFIFDSADL